MGVVDPTFDVCRPRLKQGFAMRAENGVLIVLSGEVPNTASDFTLARAEDGALEALVVSLAGVHGELAGATWSQREHAFVYEGKFGETIPILHDGGQRLTLAVRPPDELH